MENQKMENSKLKVRDCILIIICKEENDISDCSLCIHDGTDTCNIRRIEIKDRWFNEKTQ